MWIKNPRKHSQRCEEVGAGGSARHKIAYGVSKGPRASKGSSERQYPIKLG